MSTISTRYPADLSDAKVIATMLSTINSDVSQISSKAAVRNLNLFLLILFCIYSLRSFVVFQLMVKDKALDLTSILKDSAGKEPLSDILVVAYGMIEATSNGITVSNIFRLRI